ncbi:helix-turn-helix transcriptional regulator [Halalkalibacter oceani]|uniref:helix-turn-helix transcriptional regulator n=1 Tax=Halalkalibacter oceani TaxID=1653776 RepID=UPI003398D552
MVRKLLFELRGKKSRAEVAEKLDITPQMLGAIERGDRTPSLPLAKRIADYYNLSVDEIFFTHYRNETCPLASASNKTSQQPLKFEQSKPMSIPSGGE